MNEINYFKSFRPKQLICVTSKLLKNKRDYVSKAYLTTCPRKRKAALTFTPNHAEVIQKEDVAHYPCHVTYCTIGGSFEKDRITKVSVQDWSGVECVGDLP
jgi:hypothetical protein